MRLVVKIGSNLIQTPEGDIDLNLIAKLGREIKRLKSAGDQVVIVSSGAVLCGLKKLNLQERPKSLVEKQALAGIGQAYLMHLYDMVFSNYKLVPAQVLLTSDVFREKTRFENTRGALEKLLQMGAIPIINENDTVAVEELLFGDNDFLAVHTSFMLQADMLVILSTAGGLRDDKEQIVPIVEDVDRAFRWVRGVNSTYGTGGMLSKLTATKIAVSLGIPVVITGKEDSLENIKEGRTLGTFFQPSKPLRQSKKVLAMMEEPKGAIYIDEGAYKALKNGKSLLPAGIKRVEGSFYKGQVVMVYTEEGMLVGKGRVSFSSDELRKVLGKRGEEVKEILRTNKEEAIHRDYMVVF
ncbi:glutamate 5-kinase [Thermocrinis sp.]